MYTIDLGGKGYLEVEEVIPNMKSFEKYGFEFEIATKKGEKTKFSWPDNIQLIANRDGSANIYYYKSRDKERQFIGEYTKNRILIIRK